MMLTFRALLVAVLLVLVAVPRSDAVPAVRTFRGMSRYTAMYVDHEPAPLLPNPREQPEAYAKHRHTESYIRQGLYDERPEWANAMLRSMQTLLAETWTLVKLASPYFANKGYGVSLSDVPFDDDDHTHASVLPNLHADSGFDYNKDKVRGVNIGNWLLFELWMDSDLSNSLNSHAINAPHANAIVDEWTAGLYSDYNYASGVLRAHFDSWFTEQDMIDIKNAGLNHVRIPFPYWAFAEAKGQSAPYLTLNRFDKLIEACGWARTHGIKVWVDIHGVPGSQNGYDNSGHTGPIHWADKPDYYTRTQYTFNRLATLFSQPEWKGTVTAIEAVNEPLATNSKPVKDLIEKYYPWARDAVARPPNSTDYSSLLLVIHDGFLGPAHWENFFTGRSAHRVLLDTHPYYVYTPAEKKMQDSGRLREVCAKESIFTRSQKFYPTIAGEWSVNGPNGDRAQDRDLPRAPFTFPVNAPYSQRYQAFMSRNYAVQTATYEKGAGWIFWSWKNRNARDWSYKTGLQYGWIPKDAGAPSPYGKDPCADYR